MRSLFLPALMALALGCNKRDTTEVPLSSLVATLRDQDPNMRYWAATSLGERGVSARSAVPDLLKLLKDPEPMVRMGAAYALAEIRPDARVSVSPLREALKDKDKEVREAATLALKKIQAGR
jgi:hypothetical protein